jgi:hypothetical protein
MPERLLDGSNVCARLGGSHGKPNAQAVTAVFPGFLLCNIWREPRAHQVLGQPPPQRQRNRLRVYPRLPDNAASEVIVGEQGKVTGMVVGHRVIVRGTVSGVICGKTIALQSSSHVEGDIHHLSLAIEEGAMFDGRSRRVTNESDLTAIVQAKAAG